MSSGGYRNGTSPVGVLFARPLAPVSASFAAFCLVLAAGFGLGGGARGDLASLMILRPLSIVLLGYGLSRLRWAEVRANAYLFAMALAMVVLVLAHLLPLPSGWWGQLPGRGIIAEIDRAAGLGPTMRPLSLAPDMTLNALLALALPLAALVIGVRLDARERALLLDALLVLGAVDALLSVAQLLGDRNGSLYFYDITNRGSPVGLFANRNHQALFSACLLPVAAVWASRAQAGLGSWRGLVALAYGLCLLSLILVTGSRLGVIGAILAFILTPLVFLGSRRSWLLRPAILSGRNRSVPLAALAIGLVGAVVAAAIWLGRDLAWQRLAETSPLDDMRARILPTLTAMIREYAPWGTGIGSFEQAYRLHEPDALLDTVYMNHAHDDWLEVLLVAGIPGALLLAAAAAGFCMKARRLYGRSVRASAHVRIERLGLVLVLLFAAASFADYPLRVPSLAVTFVIALLWVAPPARPDATSGRAR